MTVPAETTAVDVHAHFAPASRFEEMRAISPNTTPAVETNGDFVYFKYPSGTVNGPVPRAVVDVDQRLADMARTGVTHQVLSARPQMFTYDLPGEIAGPLCQLTNDGLVEVATAHTNEFSVLMSLPLQDTDASVAEIKRWAPNRIVRGAMIDSNYQRP